MPESRTPTVLKPHGVLAALRARWLTLAVLLVALVLFVGWFRQAFYDQGYAPEQPIAYSHKLHAGDLKIDCKYCHFNAERGRHAGVPPSSVCLGCHGPQQGAVKVDSPEIQKLLAMTTSESGSYKDEATGIVHEGGAVHWKRIHKLPDFVYFSHQWHVKAGVACQTCHGPIEEMVVVRQHANLTMGWCIDCHRNTNYVGGPAYDPARPETFSVGTGNYDVVRDRIKPDGIADFAPRPTYGHDGHGHGEAKAPDEAEVERQKQVALAAQQQNTDRPFLSHGAMTESQEKALAKLIEAKPALRDLPNWRLVDLPETHRIIYQELIAKEVEAARRAGTLPAEGTPERAAFERQLFLRLSFHNSPTQCSTCHQ